MRLFALVIAALLQVVTSVYQDEAGTVDFHLALLGEPSAANTFFHQPYAASKAALIYTLSEKNVLGALNPRDGSIVWRQRLPTNSSIPTGRLVRSEDQDVVVAAVGDTVTAWSAPDGRLVWEEKYYNALVKNVALVALPEAGQASGTKDVLVLLEGENVQVRRIDGASGETKWIHEDTSGDIAFRVSASGTGVYFLSLQKALLRGYKTRVSSLDPTTGNVFDQNIFSSDSEISSENDVLYAGEGPSLPLLVWSDPSRQTVRACLFGQKQISTLDMKSTRKPIESIHVHASSGPLAMPHFLVHVQTEEDHWAEVYHVDLKKSAVSKAYDLPTNAGYGAFSASHIDSSVYFTRVSGYEVTLVSSASHGRLERFDVKEVNIPGLIGFIHPVQAASEVILKSDSSFAVRSAVLYSSGDWILIRNGATDWTRPEALAGILKAEWFDEDAHQAFVEELEAEFHINPIKAYVHRISRHVNDLQLAIQALPTAISEKLDACVHHDPTSIMGSFTNSIAESITETIVQGSVSDMLKKVGFGFHKTIVAATENGRLVAISPINSGTVVWNKKLPSLADVDRSNISTVGSLAKRYELLRKGPPKVGYTSSRELLGTGDMKTRYSYRFDAGVVKGYGKNEELWEMRPQPGHEIVSVTAPALNETVASIGKALGDRSVLYKYLNPNAVLVLAKNDAKREISLTLLDTISGMMLYSTTHQDVDALQPISSVVSENWFAYSFTSDISPSSEASSKGHLLAVAELYESPIPNDRGPLGIQTNYSYSGPSASPVGFYRPHVISQVFQIPEPVSHMSVTQTKQGITSRQLLLSLPLSKSIVAVPGPAIDARRVVGGDPTSLQQSEEGLTRYGPFIEFNPQWYLTHAWEVMGVEKIIASPSYLESTSLLFAYGDLDIFGTRLAPSFGFDMLTASFNKIQLVLTVVALCIGVVVVRPLVTRKQVGMMWQT